jgi:multiple sugar transport system permease protein
MLDLQFGIAQHLLRLFVPQGVSVFDSARWTIPMIAVVTIWWTNGFNVLLFIAGLRNIPTDYYDTAALDGALLLTLLAVVGACIWAFPLYWAIVTQTRG